MGGAIPSKSLIQFSVESQGCVPSLLFDLRPNYGGGDEDNGDLLQKVSCMHCYTQHLNPAAGHHRLMPPPRLLEASLCQSLVGSLLVSLGSWCAQDFVCFLQESVSQSCGSSVIKSHWFKVKFLGVSQSLCQIPRCENLLWALELLQQ